MNDYLSYDGITNKSEIARLRYQIEAECQALHSLSLPSSCATHEMISARYRVLDRSTQELGTHVGKEEATQTMLGIYNTTV